jgi:hypothetical protein
MTNKQLAKQLRDIGNSLFDRTNDPNFKLLLDEASDRLENQSKWISVEERLPDEQGHFLIVDKEEQMNTVFYTPRFGWFSHFRIKNITHWMPLPEAPKVKGGE